MSKLNDRNIINLLFTGDFIPPESKDSIYEEDLSSLLKKKDFSIVNLEAPLTTCSDAIAKTGNNFKRNPDSLKHIQDGYFDAVALSNNHIRDFGDKGVIDTIELCRTHGIMTVGAGKNIFEAVKPLKIEIKGKRIVVLNYSEHEFNIASERRAGANPFDLVNSYYSINEERQINDFVIVIYHGGLEYSKYPLAELVKKFKFLIDVGADAIVSHHSHYYSGLIEYKKKPIFFGLGNFFSKSIKQDDNLYKGLIAKLTINDNGVIIPFLIPIIHNTKKNKLVIAKENVRSNIMNEISELSNIIENHEKLESVWESYYKEQSNLLINQLISASRKEYKLRKIFPYFNRISTYKLLNVLNLIRCESHNNKAVKILGRILDKTLI